ncbi:MAG: sarcosine oxidase subunit gamma [Steroidobacteraceae bacterium]
MVERRSVLTTVVQPRAARTADAPLTLGEAPGFVLLQATAFPGAVTELARIAQRLLGAALPLQVGVAARAAQHALFKVGPESFWIAGPAGAWEAALRDAVPGEIGSVLSLSHGRTRLFIEGAASCEVLCRGIGIDLHPEVFGTDAFALTELVHTPVLLHRCAAHRYELYVLTTYAEWVWDWLADAALPFDSEVTAPSTRTV